MEYSFGDWVKRRRKALDLTQQELARKVGCSVATIFKIESDERRPSRQIAELLAIHLEIPPEQQQLFLKVARQEKTVDSLGSMPPASPPHPVSSSDRPQVKLPASLTSLIGREHELQMIVHQIQDPACRLLTLTGPGGVGKTRLALEAAYQLQDSFSHATGFVSLVGASASEYIVPAIADVLGFSFAGTTEPKLQLFNFLKEKKTLLVLDNLEQLLDGIEVLGELLEYTHDVKLIATSRETLKLSAEWAFEVQGLPVPAGVESQNVETNSAVSLFLQRAKQAKIGFNPSGEDLAFVKRICQLVEGLPLGLELAASWVRILSVKEVAQEIEKSIDFLTTTARDIPQRHRSIRAVFDHSWSLLSRQESQVMQRLSLFRGGFTRAAAQTIAGASLPLLSALVERSLVRPNGPRRYDLHELIRQYAESHLHADQNEEQSVRRRYAEYYMSLLANAEFKLRSEHQINTLGELKPEIDNIRQAWVIAVTNEDFESLRRAADALYYFYELQQLFQEVESLFRIAAEKAESCLLISGKSISVEEKARLEGARAVMQTRQAFFIQRMGRIREAIELYRANLERLKDLDEPFTTAYTLVFLGVVSLAAGNPNEAHQYLTQSAQLTSLSETPWLRIVALGFLGEAEYSRGRYEEAYVQFSESMELCERTKDPYITLLIGTLFSRTAQVLGRLAEAEELLSRCLRIARESGNRWGIGLGLEQMALIARSKGDLSEAHGMLEESVDLHRKVGDMWSCSRALNSLSQLEISCRELEEAELHAIDAYTSAAKGEFYSNAIDGLATLAHVYFLEGKHTQSLELILFIQDHASSTQYAMQTAERVYGELASQFLPQDVEAARRRAQSFSVNTLVQNGVIP